MAPLFHFRKYNRKVLDEALGSEVLPVLEQFLEDQGFLIQYPMGWILGYFTQANENPSLLKSEIGKRVDCFYEEGCSIVFALLEWGDHSERDDGIMKSSTVFSEMGWAVSSSFAATKREPNTSAKASPIPS